MAVRILPINLENIYMSFGNCVTGCNVLDVPFIVSIEDILTSGDPICPECGRDLPSNYESYATDFSFIDFTIK